MFKPVVPKAWIQEIGSPKENMTNAKDLTGRLP